MQHALALILRHVDGEVTEQRRIDSYVNATAMCQAAGRLFGDYARLKPAEAFLEELSCDMGIPISEIIQSIRGGGLTVQGSWVHPNAAIHLGQWLSPRFAVLGREGMRLEDL